MRTRPTAQDKARSRELLDKFVNNAAHHVLYICCENSHLDRNGNRVFKYNAFVIDPQDGRPIRITGYLADIYDFRLTEDFRLTGQFYSDAITERVQAHSTEPMRVERL